MHAIVKHMRLEETLLRQGLSDPHEYVPPGQAAKQQWEQISGGYVSKLSDSLREHFGVELDPRTLIFQKFDLANQEEQNKLSQAVFARAQAETKKVDMKAQQELALLEREKVKTETETEVSKKLELAKADQEIAKIQQETDAEAIRIQSKAKAEAIITKADAEKQARDLFPEGVQLQMSKIASEALNGCTIMVSGGGENNPMGGLLNAFTRQLMVNQGGLSSMRASGDEASSLTRVIPAPK